MNKQFTIGSRTVGENSPVFIVAEMSANHLQDYNRALEIIHAAKEAGADAVKLQTYRGHHHPGLRHPRFSDQRGNRLGRHHASQAV